jgi:hypothetical protein
MNGTDCLLQYCPKSSMAVRTSQGQELSGQTTVPVTAYRMLEIFVSSLAAYCAYINPVSSYGCSINTGGQEQGFFCCSGKIAENFLY